MLETLDDCEVDAHGPRFQIRLTGPTISGRLEQALGVRVLDAVRSSSRTFGEVNVSYHATTEPSS